MSTPDTLYNTYTNFLYYQLNELLKTYRIFVTFDKVRAKELLAQINDLRLAIALIAEQRQIFWAQIDVPANASGYKNDVFFTSDDIKSLISRLVSNLSLTTLMSLTQIGKRENIITREILPQQQLASATQNSTTTGQSLPFDLPQEIYLDKNEALDLGITNQTTDAFVFVHGCNLKDDYSPQVQAIKDEIWALDEFGQPNLPQPVLVPILFQFVSATLGTKATASNGGTQIFSVKGGKSVILTDVSTTSINSRISLIDNARNQTICDEVESLGVAGFYTNRFSVYYPLPYWHLLRMDSRFEFSAINGSLITGAQEGAAVQQTMCFRGWTI